MTITLRTQSATGASTKGSTLTHVELDNNFIDILQNKIQAVDVRGDTGTQLVGQSLGNEVLNVVGGTGISTAVTSDSAGQARITITNTSSGATITDDTATNATRYILFEDVTTGSLSSVNVSSTKLTFNPSSGQMQVSELSTDSIVSKSTDAAIAITPNGTGDVQLNADTVRVGDNNTNVTITTNGTGDLILNTNSGSNSGTITIQDGLDNDITLVPSGTGKVHFETSETRVGINNTNAKITTKGTGDLTLNTNSGTNSGSIVIYDGVNGNIEIVPNGTGQVKIDYSLWPVSDGTASQVLSTNGSGVLSWVAGSTFAPASPGEIGATTPDIGNFTDLKVKSASSVVKELQLHDQDNSNYVGFKAPVTVSSNRVWTLPSADGTANQVLSTNGSGTLSFATASVAISTGVTGLGSNVATFLATPSSANLISAITDETGTGALVFATSPTLVTPALGTPSSGNLTNCTADGTAKVGYRVLPAVGTKTGSYTLAVGDVGEYVQVGSGGSITIPNSTFAEGDVIVIANNHTAAITITCTITDAYIAGTDVDKATVSLATRGVCNILFLSGTRCIITGNVS